MIGRLFRKKIKVSYGITVCDEAVELERLILFLLLYKDEQDEIIVLQDTTVPDEWVSKVIATYRDQLIVKPDRLNHDFAAFKNKLINLASGDYLFQIDADEIPRSSLLCGLKNTLAAQFDADCFAVPRANFVKGLTAAFLDKWNWQLDAENRINFPDYQLRIFKLNQAIFWKNKVHEELHGYKNCYFLPAVTDEFCLIHIKDIGRQQRQNDFYNSL